MANFCTKCGTPLVDGRCPKCDPKPDTSPKGDKKENGEDTEVHPVHENYIQAILNMIRRPVTGFQESVADENSKVGLILMGIEALASGLCVFFLIDKLISKATAGLTTSYGTFGSTISSQLPSAGGYFLKEVIFSMVFALITSLLVWGLMRGMGKAEINWFQSCQIVGVKSLGCAMGWILAAVGVIVELNVFAVIVLLVGMVLGNIYYYAALFNYPKTKKDGVTYAALLIVIIMAVIMYLVLTQMMTSAIGSGLDSLNSLENLL